MSRYPLYPGQRPPELIDYIAPAVLGGVCGMLAGAGIGVAVSGSDSFPGWLAVAGACVGVLCGWLWGLSENG